MTVYVDDVSIPAKVGRHVSRWCHLLSDVEDRAELHGLAERIGLCRAHYQAPGVQVRGRPDAWWRGHYDLTEGKRRQAITAGAVPINFVAWSRLVARIKDEASDVQG